MFSNSCTESFLSFFAERGSERERERAFSFFHCIKVHFPFASLKFVCLTNLAYHLGFPVTIFYIKTGQMETYKDKNTSQLLEFTFVDILNCLFLSNSASELGLIL
jgi:hypothetical protein